MSAGASLRRFLAGETAPGLALIAASALALIVANSPLGESYRHLLHAETGPTLSAKLGPMTPHLWINDALMAVFFLYVGLEIKREFVSGHLSSWERRRLPVIAAAAGMAVPAAVYLLFVSGRADLAPGWAIPAATDIAFAMGVLALLGPRVPASLKLLLVTVAIVDDLGAVAIIALAYTPSLNTLALAAAAGVAIVIYVAGRNGLRSLPVYLLLAAMLWYATLSSGVHATVAGVIVAAAMPAIAPASGESPLERLEHALSPWVSFLIVPLFGFANAGVSFAGMGPADLVAPVPLAIAAGLFFGKQAGVFGAIYFADRLGIAQKPAGASWAQLYGVALLCGIGFTMSLFIGALAFPRDPLLVEQAKLGTLMGSLAAAVAGYAVLRLQPFAGPRS